MLVIAGPLVTGSISELSSINVEEMGTVGRLFGALISKAGIPVPTEITQKVDLLFFLHLGFHKILRPNWTNY